MSISPTECRFTNDRMTYLVIADEGHKDVVIGAFETLGLAQAAVQIYQAARKDPFCWIEESARYLTNVV